MIILEKVVLIPRQVNLRLSIVPGDGTLPSADYQMKFESAKS